MNNKSFAGILLISDFDGTLYSHEGGGFEENLAAVEGFKSKGGRFTIATGRDENSLREIFPEFLKYVNAPVILSNGSRLFDFKESREIYSFPLENRRFARFLSAAKERFPALGARLSFDKGFFIPFDCESIRQDLKWYAPESIFYSDIEALKNSGETFTKCVLTDSPENLDRLRQFGENSEFGAGLCFSRSYDTGLEAVNYEGTKGKMTQKLKAYFHGRYKTAAIGDYDNDFDMIESADISAAPENAQEHVKKAADINVCHCKKGAVAEFIKMLEQYI